MMLFPPKSSYRKLLTRAAGETNMKENVATIMKILEEENKGMA